MENLAHIVQLQGTSEIGLKLKKKKKKKIAKDDSTESEGDNLDLSVEMFPLSHYVSDQEELVNQIFATIRGPKLEGMMPPVLRSIPLNELKKLCLHELRGMSKKRILCIINGQDMDASSESELEDEKGKDITDEKPKEKVVSPKNPPENTNKTDEPTSNKQAIPDYLMKTIKAEPPDDGSPGDKTGAGGKSVLELLELQMRARIIKTMLEKGEDGKALTEGALAALIATPVQPSPLSEAVNLDPVIATTVASGEESKNERKVHTDVEKISKEKGKRTKRNSEGRTVQEEDGRQSKDGHNKSHRSGSRRGYKRHRSNEAKNNDDDGHENKHKRERFSSKSSKTKKKITRKEFEERMKRAKKNRSYRPRKSSEDEEKAQNNKIKDEAPGTVEKSKEGETEEGKKNEGQTFEDKEEGEVGSGKEEGEATSEKEEGECDTDDEEDGACSPSDISSASSYSSRSYSSRSRSRSFSRSWSRSPKRKKDKRYSRGRSRSRSWTRSRSRSRSRSIDRNRTDGGRWARKKSYKDRGASGGKRMSGGIVSLPGAKQKLPKEDEDNWGQKCDIEFVDSEEDFDDNPMDTSNNLSVDSSKKPLPLKGQNSERLNISFSLQKKPPPSINPCIDLDDLPLKLDTLTGSKERKEILNKKNRPDPDEIINLDSPKPILNEILISSDSENEVKASTKAKSVRVERRELVPSALETGGPTKSIKPALPELTKDLKNVNFVQNVSLDKELDRAVRKGISMDNNSSEKQSPKTDTVPITSKWPQNICDEAQEQCSKESESLEEQVEQSVSVDKKIIKNEGQDILAEDKGGNECEHSGINSSNEPHVNIETTSNTIVVESIPESSKRKADIVKEGKSDGKYTFTEANSDNAAFMNSESADKELESNSSRETSLKISYSREKKSVGKPYKTKGAKASRGKKNTLFNVDEVAKLQKVKLDHLQTSYDEEQQKIIEEPTKLTQDKSDDPINRVPEKIVEESTVLEQEKDVTKHMVSEQDCASVLEATSVRNVTSPLCKSALESDAIPLLSLKSCEESKELITDDDVKVSKILSEEENTEVIPNKEQYEEQIESKVNSKDGNNVDDFYRGADQLDLSDDDIDVEKAHEDFLQDDREVEPIRIETGLIRKRILHAKKSEWTAPGISWTKKEKKKREKPKDVLAMEGVGLLKTALAENIQSPISKDGEEEEFQSQDSSEGKVGDHGNDDDDTRASWGVPSSLSKVDTTSDLKVQSSREVNLKETSNINEDDRIAAVDEDLPQKRSGQDTEIIGVIGTIPDPDSEHIEGIDLGGSSWSMRWLQSEKVQKVVSSSKMLSRVRKKFQKKDKATKVVPVAKPEVIQKQLPDPVVPIIGSIEEYERLFGMRVKQPSGEETMGSTSVHESAPTSTGSAQANVTGERTAPQKKPAVFGSDDEGEDSEEEALWSKILGK